MMNLVIPKSSGRW